MLDRDLRSLSEPAPAAICAIAAAVVGSAVVGAGASMYASSKATKASQQGTDASIAAQQQQYAQTRADEQPFVQSGYGALNALNGRLRVTPQNSSGQVIGAPAAGQGAQPAGATRSTIPGGTFGGYGGAPYMAGTTPSASAPAGAATPQPSGGGVIDMVQQPNGSYAAPTTQGASQQPQTLPALPSSGATPAPTSAQPAANTAPGPNGTANGYAPTGTYGSATDPTYTDPGAFKAPTPFSYGLTDYKASPAYSYQLDQALKGTEATASATGSLRSGAAAKALQDRAQNIALTDFGNERNFALGTYTDQRNFDRASFDTDRAFGRGTYQDDRNYLTGQFNNETGSLFNIAGMGQAAAGQTAASGQSSTNGIVNALQTNAGNQGSAAIAGANSISSLLGSGVNALSYAKAAGTPSLASAVTAGVNANPLLF